MEPCTAILVLGLIVGCGFLSYQAELVLPIRPPNLANTYTPLTQPPPSSVGSFDILGQVVSPVEAERLCQTETGQTQLSPENGAIEITDDLIQLGRDVFYRETFGNERFITDVVSSLDGPINLVTIGKAIVRLGGKPTTNLQIPVDQDVKAVFARSFVAPQTYPSDLAVPLPPDPPTIAVPTDITPKADQERAFAVNDPSGGYKVPSLIGLAVTAPYLHDGGVAASSEALQPGENGFQIAQPDQLGMVGTVRQNIPPDAVASLRLLLDRRLREPMIAVNRANPDLQRSNVDGSGHAYWVDQTAGFTIQEQTSLIQFLLSLDDNSAN